ncbi:MAG: metal dependent hydrolase [Firmicutes bacterium]|nr:metal dependent hydrolase [Bacillota bacterium]
MIIKMLIDNKGISSSFKTEHGLSMYFEVSGVKILFDTGKSGDFIDNAEKMDVNIKDIDIVIISHAHIDHSGGLIRFLEINKKAVVYAHSKVTEDYYIDLIYKKNISMPLKVFEKYKTRICFVNNDLLKVSHNIYLVSNFTNIYSLGKFSKNLLVKRQGNYYKDSFDHELAMVIDNNEKLIIISACSHNGIDNMIETIIKHFPNKSVQTIIGGFHLIEFPLLNFLGEKKSNIIMLGKRLLGYNMDHVYTCHCTGNRELGILKECMGNKIEYFATGMQIEI